MPLRARSFSARHPGRTVRRVSVRRSHQAPLPPVARPAEPPLDVLTSGSDPAPRGLRAGAALVLVLVVGAGLLARQGASGRADPASDRVGFALHPSSVVVPRHVPPGAAGMAVAGLHVEIVNTGGRAVVLSSVSLVPGPWVVEIADRHELQPGWTAVLDLRRDVDCGASADPGAVPRQLVVRAESDGQLLQRTLDVGPAQQAYGGRLDDVLARPGAACDPESAVPLLGPIGDLLQPDPDSQAG